MRFGQGTRHHYNHRKLGVDISVLGTGTMGTAVASGLLNAGHHVTVWNRSKERAQRLVTRGARAADTAEEAIGASSHTILVFSDEQATRQVLFANGTREALRNGALASAVAMAPESCLALAKDVKAAGGRLSDVQITTYPNSCSPAILRIKRIGPGFLDHWVTRFRTWVRSGMHAKRR